MAKKAKIQRKKRVVRKAEPIIYSSQRDVDVGFGGIPIRPAVIQQAQQQNIQSTIGNTNLLLGRLKAQQVNIEKELERTKKQEGAIIDKPTIQEFRQPLKEIEIQTEPNLPRTVGGRKAFIRGGTSIEEDILTDPFEQKKRMQANVRAMNDDFEKELAKARAQGKKYIDDPESKYFGLKTSLTRTYGMKKSPQRSGARSSGFQQLEAEDLSQPMALSTRQQLEEEISSTSRAIIGRTGFMEAEVPPVPRAPTSLRPLGQLTRASRFGSEEEKQSVSSSLRQSVLEEQQRENVDLRGFGISSF